MPSSGLLGTQTPADTYREPAWASLQAFTPLRLCSQVRKQTHQLWSLVNQSGWPVTDSQRGRT